MATRTGPTTLKVAPDVRRALKVMAAERGVTLQALVEELLLLGARQTPEGRRALKRAS